MTPALNPPAGLSRRQVMQLGAAGLATLAVACSADDSADESGEAGPSRDGGQPDTVVVIGSGLAGLAAARKLADAGRTVIVLEAKDGVGGRTRTDRSLGIAFDLGASWIHGTKNNPITGLAAKAGATTVELDFGDVTVFDEGGAEVTVGQFEETEAAYEAMLEAVAEEGADGDSFADVLASVAPDWFSDRLRAFFTSAYVVFDTGALDELSSTLLDAGEEFGGPEVVMSNGYDLIAQYLADGLDIRLDHPVTSIAASSSGVTVVSRQGTFEADAVVVAVPLGVMKAGGIEFQPALGDDYIDAIESVGFNAVNKFLFVFDETFWDDSGYLVYTPTRRDVFNWFANVNALQPGANALMTFAYADEARASESRTDDEIIGLVMQHLRDMYGAGIPDPIEMRRSAWVNDPFTGGAYSFTSVTTRMEHFDVLATPAGRVHFAGEHTNRDFYSTAHGAYLSGLRAAEEILDA